MNMFRFTVEDLERLLPSFDKEGSFDGLITGIAALDQAAPGELSFLGNNKYKNNVSKSEASIILLPKDYEGTPKKNQSYLRMDNPSYGLALICKEIDSLMWPQQQGGVHPSAYVDPLAKVDPTAYIGPQCVVSEGAHVGAHTVLKAQVHVGKHARVGEDCYFMPFVSLYDYCIVGNRVRLHSGACIGSDGYGYEFIEGKHVKVPQVGIARLEDDVEVGSNTSIDRARFGETLIAQGTKIDNLVQIAHNVRIGKHCIIVALSGISGSSILEDYVILGGQVGLTGHIRIGKGSKVGGQSAINHDLEPNSFVRGAPAMPYMYSMRIEAIKKNLPELAKRVDTLEKKLSSLETVPNAK